VTCCAYEAQQQQQQQQLYAAWRTQAEKSAARQLVMMRTAHAQVTQWFVPFVG
jgi:hypothetical protein